MYTTDEIEVREDNSILVHNIACIVHSYIQINK